MNKNDINSTLQAQIAKDDYEYIIAIGTSTGGPKALNTVITALDTGLSAAYIVVQHMPTGFTKSLANRLDELSQLSVKEAEHREIIKKGTVYIAPGGKQLTVTNSRKHEITLSDDMPYKGHRPSVNIMYKSLAELKSKKKIIVVIMTGMGSDGLEGVQLLKQRVQVKVIAQNEATSVVYGMPKVVVDGGYADYVVPLNQVAETIKKIMGV